MNYQILNESYASGEGINEDELSLPELELVSQLESIKFSSTKVCTEKALKHIGGSAQVCEGTSWISCFALILDKANPLSLGNKSRGAKVIEAFLDNNYLMH